MRPAVEPLSKDARPKSGEIAIAAESLRLLGMVAYDLVGIDDLVQPDLFVSVLGNFGGLADA
jgi:hypothetical protein